MGFLTGATHGMSAQEQEAKRQYYGQFGLQYSGSAGRWGQSTQVVQGFYRGVPLQAVGERLVISTYSESHGPDMPATTGRDYRTFLRVAVPVTAVKSLAVFLRSEYATSSGPWNDSKYNHNNDLRYSAHLLVGVTSQTGVPEFDANFMAVTNDESLDGTVLTQELACWIAEDRRSYAPRIVFHDQQAALCFQGRDPNPDLDMFLPEWIFSAAGHLLDLLANASSALVRSAPSFAPPAPEPEQAPAEQSDPVLTEPEVSNRARYFAGHRMQYSAAQHDRGESHQQVSGPYRGVSLHAFGERLLVEPAIYRNFLQVHIEIGKTDDLIIFNAADHRTGIPPWTDNKYLCSLDMHAENVVAVHPRETGVPEFDARFRVLASAKYAQKLMRPELAAWIADDPRSPEGRIMFHKGSVSWCQMSGKGSDAEDLFVPDRIFAAADYVLDLLAHVSPDLMRPVPYQG